MLKTAVVIVGLCLVTVDASGQAASGRSQLIGVVNLQQVAQTSALGQAKAREVADAQAKGGSVAAAEAQSRAQGAFQEAVTPIVAAVAESLGLDLVLSAGDSGVVWVSNRTDITDRVIALLDGRGSASIAAPTAVDEIQNEIEQIRRGRTAPMPRAQASAANLGGQSGMVVENGTPYLLTVRLSGPTSQRLQLPAGSTQTISLPPGSYEVAASVASPNVIPFYGKESFSGNTRYSERFYIEGR